MYIEIDATESISELLIKRKEKSTNENNSLSVITTRISTIVVIISWYIYGKYAYFCLRGLIRHKNLNFLFPLAATLFAFANNTNDIANYIYHQSDCYPFWLIFVASATLNWAPISWLQAYRLALISKIYLSKLTAVIITTLAVILSSIYCTFYFLNLSLFDYTKNDAIGCAVTNPGTWTPYIMMSDISDSVFSLASICIIIFKSINHLKELNTRNEKLNDLVAQGIVELFVIAVAKIIIYPLIRYTSSIPGLDVFWDILSMIVIISAYNLVNFPYEHSDATKNRHNIRKNIFHFIDTNINHSSGTGSFNDSASKSFKKSSYVKIPSSTKSPNSYHNKSSENVKSPTSYKNSENNISKNSETSYSRNINIMNNESHHSPIDPTYRSLFNYDTINSNYNDNYNNNHNNNQYYYNKY